MKCQFGPAILRVTRICGQGTRKCEAGREERQEPQFRPVARGVPGRARRSVPTGVISGMRRRLPRSGPRWRFVQHQPSAERDDEEEHGQVHQAPCKRAPVEVPGHRGLPQDPACATGRIVPRQPVALHIDTRGASPLHRTGSTGRLISGREWISNGLTAEKRRRRRAIPSIRCANPVCDRWSPRSRRSRLGAAAGGRVWADR